MTASSSAPPRERWLVAVTEYAGLTAYTGGIGRHYAALLPALVRLGINVDLLVFSESARMPHADLGGVRLIGFENTRRVPQLLALPARALRVRREYRRSRYDRVFLPEWCALGCALPRRAALLTNLATSMRLANEISGFAARHLPLGNRLAIALQQRMEDLQIRRSAGLIAISRAMLERTQAAFGELPPARVVGNCIDVDHVADASRRAGRPVGWPEGDGPVILFLGRLERRKGVTDAVQAFASVCDEFPSARLVLAGASGDRRFEPDQTELLELLPASAQHRVSWLGHVQGDELYRGIRDSTVTLCPSRWEGFGNVALEVKAVGTPLVCTAGSGFDDFCVDGEDCLMVPPADPTGLAAAIRRVLEDPALAADLARAGRFGVGRYTAEPVAADLAAAADDLLGSGRRAG